MLTCYTSKTKEWTIVKYYEIMFNRISYFQHLSSSFPTVHTLWTTTIPIYEAELMSSSLPPIFLQQPAMTSYSSPVQIVPIYCMTRFTALTDCTKLLPDQWHFSWPDCTNLLLDQIQFSWPDCTNFLHDQLQFSSSDCTNLLHAQGQFSWTDCTKLLPDQWHFS